MLGGFEWRKTLVTSTLKVNLRTGVCFSGGGSRALTVTMGVLRALESLGLIPHVDAISSVSGGTWASSIYMFAKDVSIKDGVETTGRPF